MQTVVETPSYLADAERLFSPNERAAIVDRLAADPRCGVIIPGSGGIRKVRSASAREVRAAARELFICLAERACPSLLAVFAKNEKANLSAAERNALGKVVVDMIESYRRQNDKSRIR